MIRKRWIMLVLLLVAMAILACGYWFSTAPIYESEVQLRIRPLSDSLVRFFIPGVVEGRRANDQEEMAREVEQLIRSRVVIESALVDPKISKLSVIRALKDPVQFLRDNLTVEFHPPSQVLVRLAGRHPNDCARIVNAVVAAFVERFRAKAQRETAELHRLLVRLHDDHSNARRRKMAQIEVLRDRIGMRSDPEDADVQTTRFEIELTKASLGVVSRQLLDLRLSDVGVLESEDREASLPAQKRFQEEYAALLTRLKDQFAELSETKQPESVDVALLERDIARLDRQIDVLSTRIDALDLLMASEREQPQLEIISGAVPGISPSRRGWTPH